MCVAPVELGFRNPGTPTRRLTPTAHWLGHRIQLGVRGQRAAPDSATSVRGGRYFGCIYENFRSPITSSACPISIRTASWPRLIRVSQWRRLHCQRSVDLNPTKVGSAELQHALPQLRQVIEHWNGFDISTNARLRGGVVILADQLR